MFRALTCPSSGGTTAQTQHLVSSLVEEIILYYDARSKKHQDTIFFFLGPCPPSNRFFKPLKHYILKAAAASLFRQDAPNLLDPLDQAILSHWVPLKHSQVLICSSEHNWSTSYNREKCYRKIKNNHMICGVFHALCFESCGYF